MIYSDLHMESSDKNLKLWWILFFISLASLLIGSIGVFLIFNKGLGLLAINNSIFWGVLITNFVFWIGIGHAGTFISAILLLLRQNWRKGINRFAEGMTIIAIVLAAIMPIIHLGKPSYFYKLLPISNNSGYFLLNFNSPLNWDFYAISTYLILSIIFFYIGMLPDLAQMRRINQKNKLLAFFAAGWTGSLTQWQNHKQTLYILAGLATVLVIAVHSIVSFDFAVSMHVGWHSSIFPIYFVLGALLSGFAMLCILAVINRKINRLDNFIRKEHFDYMSKIMLATSILIFFVYINEVFMSLYANNPFENALLIQKSVGKTAFIYYLSLFLSIGIPQLFWKKSIRSNSKQVLILSILILIGMWLERYMIIVSSSETGYISANNSNFSLNFFSLAMILFGIGFFFTFFLLFIRYLPSISYSEILKDKKK
ncbi:MAG: polysulfide reductase NrfD [Bacteroidetes bacterium]|nr:polysulfide reductase NrfD [Bacteroidota bacterium]MBT4968026.1 polysulfide reductase NrfD [Bacteroidota bacterium]MBT5992354.1 polysulfide reductase NrfD [Bacteroidota bacterium]MBT7825515.1 polysulfide reductase NrfD [Bacteroidota bacterium]